MSDYRVRRAVEADIAAIVPMRIKLIEHIREQNPKVWRSTEKRLAALPDQYREYLADDDTRLLMAEHAPTGACVGWAMGTIFRTEDFEPGLSGRVDTVWIEPEHRRHGLCGRLMGELAAFFRAAGVERVSLWYSALSPETEATWTHFGFEPIFHIAATTVEKIESVLKSGKP